MRGDPGLAIDGLAQRRGVAGHRQLPDRRHLRQQPGQLLGPRRDPDAEVGQPLRDEAFRGVDQQDRGLEAAELLDQPPLLLRVLEVVAGVGLVGHGGDEVREADGEVEVDVDARAVAAVVPVVAGPRLAADQRDAQRLALGQRVQRRRASPEPRDERLDDGLDAIGRHRPGVVLRLEPLGQAAVARQALVERRGGSLERRVIAPLGAQGTGSARPGRGTGSTRRP